MEDLIRLLGLAIPDTSTVLRTKALVAGIVGTSIGLMCMASGVDGLDLYGGGITACGFILTVLSVRSFARQVSIARRAERNDEQPGMNQRGDS